MSAAHPTILIDSAYQALGGTYAPMGREVSGTTADLVRDALDRPVPWMHGWARERFGTTTAWLIGRGWSADPDRRQALHRAGAVTMAINDVPEGCPPTTMWVSGDPPHYFRPAIWDDPRVIKFVSMYHAEKPLGRQHAYTAPRTPRDCPNVHFYHALCNQSWHRFLDTPWACWGTAGYDRRDNAGLRSSMLIGLRLLYHLGFRTVNLLGCDFVPHQHPNPDYYPELASMLDALRPVFDDNGFRVRQANPDAYLRQFPVLTFDQAMAGGSDEPA